MFKASSDLFSRLSSALAKKIDRNAQELTDREIRIFADHLVGSIKGLESRIGELEVEKSRLENDLATVEAERDQERATLGTRVQELEAGERRLEKNLGDAESKSDRFERDVRKLQASVDELNTDKDTLQKDNNRLNAENAGLFSDKADLERQVSVLRREYEGLESRLSQEKTRATVAETRLADEVRARRRREALEHTESEETIDPSLIGGGRAGRRLAIARRQAGAGLCPRRGHA